MVQSDPEVYHNSLKHYRYGYGLFQPESMAKLSPGSCGYIDESGRWQRLLDLTNNQQLKEKGYTEIDPESLDRSYPETQHWEPRVASTAKKTELKIKGDASALAAAGLPIDVSGAFKYSTSTNFGAILMCDAEVVVECFDHRDPFRKWLDQNADKLLLNYPTLKKHGIYIATTTYSCSDVHINVWHSKDDEIKIGVKVGVTGIGGLEPSGKWMRGTSTHSWTSFVQENERKVMFFGGVKIKFSNLHLPGKTRTTEVPQSEWRGEGDKFSVKDPSPEGQFYEAELETIGENPDVLAEEAREKQEIEDQNEDE